MACPNGRWYKIPLRFNDLASVNLQFFPNGSTTADKGYVELAFIPQMAPNVEYCTFFLKIVPPDTIERESIPGFYRIDATDNDKDIGKLRLCKRTECDNKKELSFTIILLSLQIKKKDNSFHCWPLFASKMLKKRTKFEWKIDSKDFQQKTAQFGTIYCGDLDGDKWKLTVHKEEYDGKEGLFVEMDLLEWPLQVFKMKVLFKCYIILKMEEEKADDKKEWENLGEYENDLELSESGHVTTTTLEIEDIEWNEIADNLTIAGEIIIRKLYDMSDNEIVDESWEKHNAVLLDPFSGNSKDSIKKQK